MLKLPGKLTPETFLDRYWQKEALLMPAAMDRLRPSISRNELGWLATLDDVESRLVFVDHDTHDDRRRYRAETGPFEPEYLQDLPKRNWTLLVHDVEKHLPAMRALFSQVPFIPDWRIDDLMVSFAAPGGGVGPHLDNYDVFLCQGIGVRNWRFSNDEIAPDPQASRDLALLSEFEGYEDVDVTEGDVLYLPPGVAHWGTAKRACMTYSIGMRAPQISDLSLDLDCQTPDDDCFYRDPDLGQREASPGFISPASAQRALAMLELPAARARDVATAIGLFATQTKDWLRPDDISEAAAQKTLDYLRRGGIVDVHGMSQIAFDDESLFVNGKDTALPAGARVEIASICAKRKLSGCLNDDSSQQELLLWMLKNGLFEIPENF